MLFTLLATAAFATAKLTNYDPQPYAGFLQTRTELHSQDVNNSALEVDLGYGRYRGYYNSTSKINVFRGIRFAQAPTGRLRWQAPRQPLANRSDIINATDFAAQCPQNPVALSVFQTPDQTESSEDCLFLNVYTPSDANEPLPVFVWIHGGGYGGLNGRMELQNFMTTNQHCFVGVTIQYRLGAFGFLSSDEVYRKGVVNAGILDQTRALQWVQQYIHLFNGDSGRVTIAGESAGAGSILLQDILYGGSLGTQLFRNSIAASPFVPMQYGYKDWIPTQAYYSLAARVGCANLLPYGANGSISTFECLLNVSSDALINASATVSQSGLYGTWAFVPVTDGIVLQGTPSRQLSRRKINGVNALVGNNANEGPYFTPHNIDTEEDLVAWLRLMFPLFTNNDIAKILYYYPSTNASVDPNDPLFATTGDSGPTSLNQSNFATGQQQRADNIYGEITFTCPSYWLAEAYSDNAVGGKAYKYQFSVPSGGHGADVSAWSLTGTPSYSFDFATAFSKMYGAFITSEDPSISNKVAQGILYGIGKIGVNPASEWPAFRIYAPWQLDLNITCKQEGVLKGDAPVVCDGPGPYNDFKLVNAYTWEGGRGTRCDFWRAMDALSPGY